MKRPTIKDVANRAGVSVGLVSMVLNAKRDENGMPECTVKDETAKRILDAVDALDYKLNRQASGLRSGRYNTIAVILPDISNKFFADIASHIERVAFDHDYGVIFCSTSEQVDKMARLADSFSCNNVDGLIIAPCAGSDDVMRKLIKLSTPLVCIDRVLPGMDAVPSVTLDNIRAGRLAAEALSSKHRNHIGIVSYDTDISTLTDRVNGFVDAANIFGMTVDVRKLAYNSTVSDFTEVISQMSSVGIDGLFCPSNNASVKSLIALQSLSMLSDGRIVCIGFDECDVFDISRPKIARITQSAEAVGRESFTMLLELINGQSVKSQVLMPVLKEE